MDIDRELTETDKKFLTRAAKRKSLFLMSSVATVIVAVSFLVYHGLVAKDMNGLRFVIILLLLLSGRSYLRLYKSAIIFNKLQPCLAMKQSKRD
jgi:hypothetical protein